MSRKPKPKSKAKTKPKTPKHPPKVWVPVDSIDDLTEAQRSVAIDLALGFTCAEIADSKGCATKTVDVQRHAVLVRLGLRNNVDLALRAIAEAAVPNPREEHLKSRGIDHRAVVDAAVAWCNDRSKDRVETTKTLVRVVATISPAIVLEDDVDDNATSSAEAAEAAEPDEAEAA